MSDKMISSEQKSPKISGISAKSVNIIAEELLLQYHPTVMEIMISYDIKNRIHHRVKQIPKASLSHPNSISKMYLSKKMYFYNSQNLLTLTVTTLWQNFKSQPENENVRLTCQ